MTAMMTEDIQLARDHFPRGLHQPEGTFRFSIDALLLAAFARCKAPKKRGQGKLVHMADLGTGCGVVGLAFSLLHDGVTGVGIEIEHELVHAAKKNAAMLGLDDRFSIVQGNMHDLWSENQAHKDLVQKATFDTVLTNPPYRLPQSGFAAASVLRQQALFEESGSLDDFVRTGAALLRNAGHFNVIYGAARLPDLLGSLRAHRLEPKRLRMVHGYMDKPARLVLVDAMRDVKPDLLVEPPLILYEKDGENTANKLTQQALDFCGFLGCNAR